MSGTRRNNGKEKGKSEHLMVAVRVRPLANEERQRGSYRIVEVEDDKMLTLLNQETDRNDHLRQKRNKDKQFIFDRLHGESATQKEVYEATTKALVEDVLAGYTATVFAYGPTGAGKTFTMVGTAEHPGIMVQALNDLFHSLDDPSKTAKTKISMSYLEIYNENIRDLLQPSGTLDLREDAKTGVIQVAGLSEKEILTTKEVMRLLQKGNKERTCEPTAANKTSSRSHALLQVNVRKSVIKGVGEQVKCGRLFMIDLAGSERAKQTQNRGKRLQEGAHINRSLLALGNCINALAEGQAKFVNFRDSKLTRLLKDALSGNCRTVMVAHVSPANNHREETRNTLVYADRAKNISKTITSNVVNVASQVTHYKSMIMELQEEVTRLKDKITDKHDCPGTLTQGEIETNQMNTEKLRAIKNELLENFREQMFLRNKLIDIDSNILALSMEFERQNLVVSEWEAERYRRERGLMDHSRHHQEEQVIDMDTDREKDEDSDDDEPEEVTQAWEDLMYLQKEKQRYAEMREKVEHEMEEVKKRSQRIEELLILRIRCRMRMRACRRLVGMWCEALPNNITNDEQKEIISLLCKVHELEIQKVEMRSEALLKEHELQRRELVIMRYDRQRSLCDQIITRQRQMLDVLHEGSEIQPHMPPELLELYQMYQAEAQCVNGERDGKFDIHNMLRSHSVLSLRDPNERLPPINTREPERLFDRPARRRHSLGDEARAESVLSLRSPTSSASSSAPGTAPSSRVPSLPPIRGAAPSTAPNILPEGHSGFKNNNSLLRRRGPGDPHSVTDPNDNLTDPGSPGSYGSFRKKSLADPSDDSLSMVSVRLDSPPRKARSRVRQSLLQPQPRRRHGSASSSEGESPAPGHRSKASKVAHTRRRGNSLSRLENLSQPGMWPSGNPRRQSIPVRRRRAADDAFPVAYALHRY
ncbi:kinesin-like protein KIF19 isoform X3 [Eriocheir sinensis]|uniref:kinesin-like protein KIF19 isoform X3 n=1 Tax=Eriocheir sinensis TaxID=95602 RepID=UPI0021C61BA4|nr:kinesin-like protein KIF19 isoform X3 [Eriocheir sinensis]